MFVIVAFLGHLSLNFATALLATGGEAVYSAILAFDISPVYMHLPEGVARLMMELDLAEPMMDLTHISLTGRARSKAEKAEKAN